MLFAHKLPDCLRSGLHKRAVFREQGKLRATVSTVCCHHRDMGQQKRSRFRVWRRVWEWINMQWIYQWLTKQQGRSKFLEQKNQNHI
jgi:transposase